MWPAEAQPKDLSTPERKFRSSYGPARASSAARAFGPAPGFVGKKPERAELKAGTPETRLREMTVGSVGSGVLRSFG